MYKDKRDVVKEYQLFCEQERLVESSTTASFWCELYLKRDTKINQQRISKIYEYIENKEPDSRWRGMERRNGNIVQNGKCR